jgi:serine/threonine protein kinase
MQPDRRERAEELFHRAAGLSAAERSALLDSECRGDEQLRAEVASLLAQFDSGTADFLQCRGTDAPAGPFAPGDTIADKYKLLHQLGEGGLGVVWLAEQKPPVRRKVALKVIKLGMDSRQVLGRFEAERNALALMNHPSIARVVDAGVVPTGQPFFAMEYVQGLPITTFCDRERLTTRQRLELFAEVCHAVQHAHQKGIIHRDLKPSNILVTLHEGRPLPKVIDFGIAKATGQDLSEHTVYTLPGQLLGTPEYMSPEQAEMSEIGVDSTTDIYSLGVVLYELLTGVLPFDSTTLRRRGLAELHRVILEVDAPKPSTRISTLGATTQSICERHGSDLRTLRSQLRGDLDWVVMKALEKQRTRRYAAASELAADVLRHLRNEPVLAGPPSRLYKLRKFVVRNRAVVALAVLVALALLAGVIGTSMALFDARAQRDQAELARSEAADRLRQADAVRAMLLHGLGFANSTTADTRALTVADMLHRVEADVEHLFGGKLLEQAAARVALASCFSLTFDTERALAQAEQAIALLERVRGPMHRDLLEPLWHCYQIALAGGEFRTPARRYIDIVCHQFAHSHRELTGALRAVTVARFEPESRATASLKALTAALADVVRDDAGAPAFTTAVMMLLTRRPAAFVADADAEAAVRVVLAICDGAVPRQVVLTRLWAAWTLLQLDPDDVRVAEQLVADVAIYPPDNVSRAIQVLSAADTFSRAGRHAAAVELAQSSVLARLAAWRDRASAGSQWLLYSSALTLGKIMDVYQRAGRSSEVVVWLRQFLAPEIDPTWATQLTAAWSIVSRAGWEGQLRPDVYRLAREVAERCRDRAELAEHAGLVSAIASIRLGDAAATIAPLQQMVAAVRDAAAAGRTVATWAAAAAPALALAQWHAGDAAGAKETLRLYRDLAAGSDLLAEAERVVAGG